MPGPHLDEGALAAAAQRADLPTDADAARHLAECAACADAVAQYRALYALTRPGDAPPAADEGAPRAPARRAAGARTALLLLGAAAAVALVARCALAGP